MKWLCWKYKKKGYWQCFVFEGRICGIIHPSDSSINHHRCSKLLFPSEKGEGFLQPASGSFPISTLRAQSVNPHRLNWSHLVNDWVPQAARAWESVNRDQAVFVDMYSFKKNPVGSYLIKQYMTFIILPSQEKQLHTIKAIKLLHSSIFLFLVVLSSGWLCPCLFTV